MIKPNQPGGSKYVVRGGSKIVVIDTKNDVANAPNKSGFRSVQFINFLLDGTIFDKIT